MLILRPCIASRGRHWQPISDYDKANDDRDKTRAQMVIREFEVYEKNIANQHAA